jgi:precorrin-6B methylase 2
VKSIAAIRSNPDAAAFEALAREWGNPFSFQAAGLKRLYELALTTGGPVLDLGSGLTSIVLGLAAELSGATVTALENSPEWAKRLEGALKAAKIKTVSVRLCKLQGGFYALPDDLPDAFGLVVIDGPQHLTARGQAYERLNLSGAHVVADDIRIRRIARPFDLWVLRSGRVAERCGNYAIARADV